MTQTARFFHLKRVPVLDLNTENVSVVIKETGERLLIEGLNCMIQVPSGKVFENCHIHTYVNKNIHRQEIYVDLIQFSDEQLENHLFCFENLKPKR